MGRNQGATGRADWESQARIRILGMFKLKSARLPKRTWGTSTHGYIIQQSIARPARPLGFFTLRLSKGNPPTWCFFVFPIHMARTWGYISPMFKPHQPGILKSLTERKSCRFSVSCSSCRGAELAMAHALLRKNGGPSGLKFGATFENGWPPLDI